MGFSSTSYLRQFLSLLPRGKAWTRALSSKLVELLTGFSSEPARVDVYMESIITEKDTRFTTLLLPEFEEDYGLPDACSDAGASETERRENLRSRFLGINRMDKQYYIDLALELGFIATITEFTPFWSGLGKSGDPCGDQDVLFFWQVNVDASTPAIDELACFFTKLKPAWTHLLFTLVGPAYSTAYSTAFDSIPSDGLLYLQGAYDKSYSQAFDRRNGGAFERKAYSVAYDKSG